MTTTPKTPSSITDDQADAAIAAWFGFTKYDASDNKDREHLRGRMRLAIAAAIGEPVSAPVYVVRNREGSPVDAYDCAPDMSTYPNCTLQVIGTQQAVRYDSIRDELRALLDRADKEGQVIEVAIQSVPPLAMGRFVMIGSVREASASTLRFRAQEPVESESAITE